MFEILVISIGLVLVIEGIVYFALANKLKLLLTIINDIKPHKIKTISLSIILIGICLIYFTFRYYES